MKLLPVKIAHTLSVLSIYLSIYLSTYLSRDSLGVRGVPLEGGRDGGRKRERGKGEGVGRAKGEKGDRDSKEHGGGRSPTPVRLQCCQTNNQTFQSFSIILDDKSPVGRLFSSSSCGGLK